MVWLLILILLLFVLIFRLWGIPMRSAGSGFTYVYVEEDGTIRELDDEEKEYLLKEFHPADGARPYIKSHYWQRTPDRRIVGYMLRNRVPWWMEIKA